MDILQQKNETGIDKLDENFAIKTKRKIEAQKRKARILLKFSGGRVVQSHVFFPGFITRKSLLEAMTWVAKAHLKRLGLSHKSFIDAVITCDGNTWTLTSETYLAIRTKHVEEINSLHITYQPVHI